MTDPIPNDVLDNLQRRLAAGGGAFIPVHPEPLAALLAVARDHARLIELDRSRGEKLIVAEAEHDALAEALKRYGDHAGDCESWEGTTSMDLHGNLSETPFDCTCGFAALLSVEVPDD